MPSEKMRYLKSYPANEALRNTGLLEKAKTAFAGIGPEKFNAIAKRFTDFDPANIYFVITHFVKLSAAELRLVLEAAIEMAKDSDDIISEDDERKLWSMIEPVLERSVELAEAGNFIDAVEAILAFRYQCYFVENH
jgi:hypothetical protein